MGSETAARMSKTEAMSRLTAAANAIEKVTWVSACEAFVKWHRDTRVTVERIFGPDSRHVSEFSQVKYIPGRVVLSSYNPGVYQTAFRNGLTTAHAVLRSMASEVSDYWEDDCAAPVTEAEKTTPDIGRSVFVVHGHDEGAKQGVARFLERLGLEAVILHEQPHAGAVLIEKIEREEQNVDFAVVLLTGDDYGYPKVEQADKAQLRARQNVIFELGFFIGKIRRGRVCALYEEGVERPSDIDGLAYVSYDKGGAWKMELARELKAAGFDIDMNKVL